jgi:hypothetical protein
MILALSLAGLALRAGLRLRRARLGRRPRPRGDVARHARLGKLAVAGVCFGYGAGLVSMAFLRGREVFQTPHSLVASLALGLFLVVGILGFRLERRMGRRRPVNAHALLALAAALVAAVSLATGFVILP